jgi:hypothetical protein
MLKSSYNHDSTTKDLTVFDSKNTLGFAVSHNLGSIQETESIKEQLSQYKNREGESIGILSAKKNQKKPNESLVQSLAPHDQETLTLGTPLKPKYPLRKSITMPTREKGLDLLRKLNTNDHKLEASHCHSHSQKISGYSSTNSHETHVDHEMLLGISQLTNGKIRESTLRKFFDSDKFDQILYLFRRQNLRLWDAFEIFREDDDFKNLLVKLESLMILDNYKHKKKSLKKKKFQNQTSIRMSQIDATPLSLYQSPRVLHRANESTVSGLPSPSEATAQTSPLPNSLDAGTSFELTLSNQKSFHTSNSPMLWRSNDMGRYPENSPKVT